MNSIEAAVEWGHEGALPFFQVALSSTATYVFYMYSYPV